MAAGLKIGGRREKGLTDVTKSGHNLRPFLVGSFHVWSPPWQYASSVKNKTSFFQSQLFL
jgi:hypothetical protein